MTLLVVDDYDDDCTDKGKSDIREAGNNIRKGEKHNISKLTGSAARLNACLP